MIGFERLLAALNQAKLALWELSDHPAFADQAPEFNEGGVGYEALKVIREALYQAGEES